MEIIWGNGLKPGDYKYIGSFPNSPHGKSLVPPGSSLVEIDPAPRRLTTRGLQLQLKSGSQLTRWWSKADSNRWSHFRINATAAPAPCRRPPASELLTKPVLPIQSASLSQVGPAVRISFAPAGSLQKPRVWSWCAPFPGWDDVNHHPHTMTSRELRDFAEPSERNRTGPGMGN
jgi:hypothetical protein